MKNANQTNNTSEELSLEQLDQVAGGGTSGYDRLDSTTKQALSYAKTSVNNMIAQLPPLKLN